MSHFAKRHYEALATTMQSCKPADDLPAERRSPLLLQWNVTTGKLATMFAEDSSKFKRDRFLAACEPRANVRARS